MFCQNSIESEKRKRVKNKSECRVAKVLIFICIRIGEGQQKYWTSFSHQS